MVCYNGLLLFILSTYFSLFIVSGKEKDLFCDDGKQGIEIDLNGNKDWKCMEEQLWKAEDIQKSPPSSKCYTNYGGHICIKDTIDNLYPSDHIPVMGPHRQVWAEYGEYKYCPPGRYVHNLEPVAILSYGCVYKLSQISVSEIKDWVQSQIGKSPESDVYGQGKYNFNMLEPSIVPDNMSDVNCKDVSFTTEKTPKKRYTTVTMENTNSSINLIQDVTSTPRTNEVAWAIASLVFLLCSIVFGLCYSQLHRNGGRHESSDLLNHGSRYNTRISVGAVVRKFPNVLKPFHKKAYIKNKPTNRYKLIENDILSEDELL